MSPLKGDKVAGREDCNCHCGAADQRVENFNDIVVSPCQLVTAGQSKQAGRERWQGSAFARVSVYRFTFASSLSACRLSAILRPLSGLTDISRRSQHVRFGPITAESGSASRGGRNPSL